MGGEGGGGEGGDEKGEGRPSPELPAQAFPSMLPAPFFPCPPHSDLASSSHILRSRCTHPCTPPGASGNGGSVGAAEPQSGPVPSRLGLRCLCVLCT